MLLPIPFCVHQYSLSTVNAPIMRSDKEASRLGTYLLGTAVKVVGTISHHKGFNLFYTWYPGTSYVVVRRCPKCNDRSVIYINS